MKPLRLEFSGLNSYRERQTVDFEQLGKGGLFGIFGPTGSGKSSVLDAVTLALYGKVDRAEHNSRGIINMREKTAEVLFAFELGGVRYQVQRRYERVKGDPQGARAGSVRLTTGDGSVLADQPRTVNERLARIIGLTYDEFSRAVVLPQGKFSQFLNLKGAERAEMLGHILRLDRFGEPLYQAAKQRSDRWRQEADTNLARRNDLGDCSDAAISKARDEAAAKAAELKQAEDEYVRARVSYDEATGLKALNDKLTVARDRKKALDANTADIERDRTSLDLARRAAPLRSLIETAKRLVSDGSQIRTRLVAVDAELNTAQTLLKVAQEESQCAREQQESQEPALTAQVIRLQEALAVKTELDGLTLQAEKADSNVCQLTDAAAKERTAVTKLQREAERIAGEVESLSERQQMLAVDPVRRGLITMALQALTNLENAEKDLGDAQSDAGRKSQAVQAARTKAMSAYRRLAAIASSRYYFDGQGNLAERPAEIPAMQDASSGSQLLAVAENEIEYAERLEREASQRASLALIRDQACVLASELREGQPCPVCGSLSHPHVTASDASYHRRATEAQEVIRECAGTMQTWYKTLQSAAFQWDNCRSNQEEALLRVVGKESSVSEILEIFLQSAKEGLGEGFRRETAKEDIRSRSLEMAVHDRQHATVSQALADARLEEAAVRSELGRVRDSLGELESRRNSAATEAAMFRKQVEDRKNKIHRMTDGEDPSGGIAVARAAIRDLRDRVRLTQATETAQRSQVDKLTREAAGLQSTAARIETQMKRNGQALAEGLTAAGFETQQLAEQAMLPDPALRSLELRIQEHQRESDRVYDQIRQLEEESGGREFSPQEHAKLEATVQRLETAVKTLNQETAVAQKALDDIGLRRIRWDKLERHRQEAEKQRDVASRLASMLRGKAFVKFLAEEHLRDMAADASGRLGSLTGQRYALEIVDGTDFAIRDDFNGGERRSVATLSGGETFLTSLALALALSSKVQLRGQYPLGFFVLDEGFGTLDDEKLDSVIGALERLHDKDRMVGVISHVKELKERLHYYLEVTAAPEEGAGSKVVSKVG